MNLQVVKLAEVPPNVSQELLRLGIQMNIPSIQGVTEQLGDDRFVRYLSTRLHHLVYVLIT
jgi:hypothetical protein